ncbi:hypothetical protein DJ95_131 [Bacillus atrophaeus subsp. globigii]|nr:hypothetical protein DJ95_131 [Bacillus atrophaeus subsp. globigii]KFK81198.1 hypothetical protein DK44_3502 [Bacillus atrophaeus]
MLLHFIPKRTVSFLFIPTHSHKKSTLLSTSTGEKFNKRTFKVTDVPYIQTKSYSSEEIVIS